MEYVMCTLRLIEKPVCDCENPITCTHGLWEMDCPSCGPSHVLTSDRKFGPYVCGDMTYFPQIDGWIDCTGDND